ncbi:979_t:CDS:2 [Diversispora eburnea]|uniref:979_t:CDS:1 n=1 Tax=Diversispora eburnea TaxID=1213867 RepID=A0A9N9B9F4_9GLOM|nr:979_t:CDS:2 [Diversispora eburnea]
MIEQLKNFIRHGKHANQKLIGQDKMHYDYEPKNPIRIDGNRIYSEKTKLDNATAVAQIVAEERVQKSKLPTYQGLERYRILEKMGEGAFSNVYKAIDTVTQEKVAIKVVRKSELNHLQGNGDRKIMPNIKKSNTLQSHIEHVFKNNTSKHTSNTSNTEMHLHCDMKNQPRAIERSNVLKEVQIMRQLKHPSIVSLLGFSESPDYYFLVLELMEGGELFHQIVKLTYFSEQLSRHVIVQVAQGIRYLHEEKGVVHRDIKPENILFQPIPIFPSKEERPPPEPNGESKEDEGQFIPEVGGGGIGKIKIADFGLSKIVWDEQTRTPCGTLGYTAPEIIKDERYSKSVDLWALGCVLYTCLCGFPPFYDESIQDLSDKVSKGQYTFLSPWWDNISSSAKDLITHLLIVNPDKRYTIQQFFEHPWVKDEPFQSTVNRSVIINPKPINLVSKVEPPLYDESIGTPEESVRRKDIISPGISLKEMFDISYAVHRMGEENARKKKIKGLEKSGGLNPFKNHHNNLNDDFSVEATRSNEPIKTKTGSIRQLTQLISSNKQQHKEGVHRRKGFDLNLEAATLLRRRKALVEPKGI